MGEEKETEIEQDEVSSLRLKFDDKGLVRFAHFLQLLLEKQRDISEVIDMMFQYELKEILDKGATLKPEDEIHLKKSIKDFVYNRITTLKTYRYISTNQKDYRHKKEWRSRTIYVRNREALQKIYELILKKIT